MNEYYCDICDIYTYADCSDWESGQQDEHWVTYLHCGHTVH